MQEVKVQKWYEAPRIAADSVNWKHPSEYWFWASVFVFAFAFAENVILESAHNAVFFLNNKNLTSFQIFFRHYFYNVFLIAVIIHSVSLYFLNLKNPHQRKKLYHKSQFNFACGMTLMLWDIVTVKTRLLPIPYFPSAAEIFCVMYDDRWLLLKSTVYSMRLFFTGLITGTVLGVGTGTCIGWWKQWDYWLSPIIRVSGVIPAVAWLPIALLVLPNSFVTGLFLIFISSWFPVSSMVASGIQSTPKSYFEVARTLGADNKFLLFKIAIPNSLPNMFTGIMTATAFSFTTLIVSEMVGAKAGLGFYINWAKGWGNYSKVYAAIIIIAIEFSLILALISVIQRRALRWQKGILK
ncbi:MAG: ABC transporter permease subunit [Termitinemataceae bacterium]|nr:MAG: ABC transporter permease subunit [Termitinemataceae bacterium]